MLHSPASSSPSGAPSPCPHCESFPPLVERAGRLFLWFSVPHLGAKLARAVEPAVGEIRSFGDGLALRLDRESTPALVTSLASSLAPAELEEVRVLFKNGEEVPDTSDLGRVESLDLFVARERARWLIETMAEDRLVSHFQPIVSLREPGHPVYGFESLVRGRLSDGGLVSPGTLFDTAREARLLFQLDLAARRCAIRTAERQRLQRVLFINFTPAAIYDPSFCLRTTVEAVRRSSLAPDQVVFEVIESLESRDVVHLQRILAEYRAAGFRVALDDVGEGPAALDLLRQVRPDFVKIDRSLIAGVESDPRQAHEVAKLFEVAGELEIRTVAEGIETAATADWLRQHGADLGQGFLYGRPEAPGVAIAAPGR